MLIPNGSSYYNMSFPQLAGQTSGPQIMDPMASYQTQPLPNYNIPSISPANAGGGGGFMESIGGASGAVNAGLGVVNTIGNLWGAYQANKMAKKDFAFRKDITETNLANQIQSYNTALSDRARSRAFTEGQSDSQRDQYIAENSLKRRNG